MHVRFAWVFDVSQILGTGIVLCQRPQASACGSTLAAFGYPKYSVVWDWCGEGERDSEHRCWWYCVVVRRSCKENLPQLHMLHWLCTKCA